MTIDRLTKYVRLALNNSSEGEAQNAARRFFKTLKSLGMRFNSRQFGLTKAEALRLAELGGVVLKGVAPTKAASAKPDPKPAPDVKAENAQFYADRFKSVRECCYYYFNQIDMDNDHERRPMIDVLCETYGFDKRSVQSYASNYRAGKWRE